MFDKSFHYFIPKVSSNIDDESRQKREPKQQFRYVSVNKIVPSAKNTYIPLASPQLSAYAKPRERIKLEQKLMRARQNRSVNFQQKQDPLNVANYHSIQHSKVDSQLTFEDQLLKIVGGRILSSEEKSQSIQPKWRRKPKTHHRIFSMNVHESLELNQLRKKRNAQLVDIRTESHKASRFNTTQIEFNNTLDFNQYVEQQKGRRCQIQQKFNDQLN
ncbi:unnamed protein product (macronuclear) [Paramecium tetraurelia]|uniref:Uncharacterized protein n=1 Tax=Paramecium tetraurelia TaxID=5888 RepID=A0E0G9_PARTE|nr:uncharacterized protein GSPATT00021954001 [Paramecium tetraurelia]CAK88786.1 unnamed protein product [Paramecium tetraurelia]|eukprot:XP_001456183.1 hypothetical protein (macronuclear) [Paramecium tetraurelia strain d4-2]